MIPLHKQAAHEYHKSHLQSEHYSSVWDLDILVLKSWIVWMLDIKDILQEQILISHSCCNSRDTKVLSNWIISLHIDRKISETGA